MSASKALSAVVPNKRPAMTWGIEIIRAVRKEPASQEFAMQYSRPSLLIVEDQPMISLMIEDLVLDLGWTVSEIVYSEKSAMIVLEHRNPTIALVDIDIKDLEYPHRIATACHRRGTAVLFLTCQPIVEVRDQYEGIPILPKPFTPCDLKFALGLALDGTARRQFLTETRL